tara:strand:- start:1441 stop:3246 length:1806 start_codon:yes stop_codon:yes gene_type:complete
MASYVGAPSWGIVPIGTSSTSNLASMSWKRRDNFLKSANDQLRFQVQWFYAGITEGTEVSFSGGIVNVIFKIETSVDSTEWTTIGEIKKSRDISNRRYDNGTQPKGHRFTIDVSQLVSDQLSYSLCPIGKGTWQSNYYGGMNGGLTMQDNVIGSNLAIGRPISEYNVSENGTFRILRVSATFEILQIDNTTGDRSIVLADNYFKSAQTLAVINSVNQIDNGVFYNTVYTIGDSDAVRWQFLTRCPNWSDGSIVQDFRKPVRIDEQAEWQQFYIREGQHRNISAGGGSSKNQVCAMGIKIRTYIGDTLENTFYLTDFQQNLIQSTYSSNTLAVVDDKQNQMFIQNMSPYYINNTAALKTPPTIPPSTRSATDIADNWDAYTGSKITDNTTRYDAFLVKVSLYSPYSIVRVSKVYHYTIDRESENIPYGFVRFHWLNSLGAIDSYTAKRDVVEGLTISRDVIERKSGDRTWSQATSGAVNGSELEIENYPNGNKSYISDTNRGGDTYKGGREVTNVNADRVQSVYTEPLNKSVANWLEEILLSPNVWIEKEGVNSNPYIRPSTKDYVPVIITNSEIETVNQSEGLVKFNLEYILSHKVKTQRN